jgi:hypothetical protein
MGFLAQASDPFACLSQFAALQYGNLFGIPTAGSVPDYNFAKNQ